MAGRRREESGSGGEGGTRLPGRRRRRRRPPRRLSKPRALPRHPFAPSPFPERPLVSLPSFETKSTTRNTMASLMKANVASARPARGSLQVGAFSSFGAAPPPKLLSSVHGARLCGRRAGWLPAEPGRTRREYLDSGAWRVRAAALALEEERGADRRGERLEGGREERRILSSFADPARDRRAPRQLRRPRVPRAGYQCPLAVPLGHRRTWPALWRWNVEGTREKRRRKEGGREGGKKAPPFFPPLSLSRSLQKIGRARSSGRGTNGLPGRRDGRQTARVA